ncbi:spermatogenesis-associated protein 22 isoform X3 [Heptranchias perlo]|uniref:spermatogenesis-associated protein 22 isoform X3 n=1 Tax=Heptranchias perlo TaxID=212740 RepID=UPI00355A4D5D
MDLNMKRNITENSTRATAGCLPVLLFNQKKRTRLPLTSNPMEHESGSNSLFPTPESFDSPPAGNKGLTQTRAPGNQTTVQNNYRAQFQYPNIRSNMDNADSGKAPLSNLAKTTSIGQLQQQVPQHQQIQDYRNFSRGSSNIGQNSKTNWNTGVRQQSGNTGKENTRPIMNERKEFTSTNGNNRTQTKITSTFRSCVPSESYKTQTKSSQQTHQWPKSSSQNTASSRRSGQPNQFLENQFESNPRNSVDQKSQPVQMKVTQPDNSLRIATTTIEGMKHWTQYSHRVALLFEVFATLDSAVIAGEHSAKNFLLRDRKDSVPCVFYETDRDLPRLIRGQVHRCMGTYDKRRNLLKCVSVRPASTVEQKTFAEFVRVADAEMTQFVKALSEV